MSVAYWICVAIAVISSYVSLGFSISGFRRASDAARTASMYAFARSLALAITASIATVAGSVLFVVAVTITMTAVQAADAGIGAIIRDRIKTIGPAATALANLAALLWLLLL